MATKYNSITETMTSQKLANDPVSSLGTLPGFLSIPGTASVFLLGATPNGAPSLYFDIRDVPNVLNWGLFCNLARYLSPNINPPNIRLDWYAINAGNAVVGNPMNFIEGLSFADLNTVKRAEFYSIFASPTALSVLRTNIGLGAVKTALAFSVTNNLGPAPIILQGRSTDAGWNNGTIFVEFQADVEHTFPMVP